MHRLNIKDGCGNAKVCESCILSNGQQGGDSSGCMHAYEKMAINFLSDWFMGSIATLEFSSITA